jgi:Protein of unknown function (DUF3800)
MIHHATHRPLSISGHALSEGKPMQLVYLDEAGISNEAQEPFLVVAGVIVNPDRRWRELEAHFAQLSKKYFRKHSGPPIVFHAKDIWHGHGLFPRTTWPLKKRLKLLNELAAIPAEFDLPIVVGYQNRVELRRWAKATNPQMTEKDIRVMNFAGAFFDAIRRVERWMLENTNEVAMLIAEDTTEVKSHIQRLHQLYTDRSFLDLPVNAFQSNRIVDAVHFAKKDQSLLLQIADHAAFFMKRKLMKKADIEKLYKKIEPQIVLRSTKATSIALRVKPSEVEIVKTPGTLSLGASQELLAAFEAVVQGARSGLGKDNLLPHLRKLREAQDQAFSTKEGRQYLGVRPSLRQRMARLQRQTTDQR